MRIVFYAGHHYWGGLRNCGGARTILLSAQTLRDLGHDVDVVATSDKFTWFKHKAILNKIPSNAEAVIACSISDIKGMHEQAPESAKKIYWMRGLEMWQQSEAKIKAKLSMGQHNIVNSSWLKRKLDGWNIPCDICWQGVDIDFWTRESERGERLAYTRIGCLYNKFHKTKRWDMFVALMKMLGHSDFKYYGFGADMPKEYVDKYLINPEPEDLRRFYNRIDIWFAPTELDSFHNVPLEAALCGCLVVCKNTETNGMEDFATPETSLRYDNLIQAAELITHPDYSKVDVMKKLIVDKISDRKTNMLKFINLIGGTSD